MPTLNILIQLRWKKDLPYDPLHICWHLNVAGEELHLCHPVQEPRTHSPRHSSRALNKIDITTKQLRWTLYKYAVCKIRFNCSAMLCDTVQCFAILSSENFVQILLCTTYWPHTCALCSLPLLVIAFRFFIRESKMLEIFKTCCNLYFLRWIKIVIVFLIAPRNENHLVWHIVAYQLCVCQTPLCGFKQQLVQQTLWLMYQIDLIWNLLQGTKM